MKVSKEKVSENQERVIDTAARLFKQKGINGIGVADLMKASGLTHGGFYRHFSSKDDLVVKAYQRAVEHAERELHEYLSQSLDQSFSLLVKQYVSAEHCRDLSTSCPLTTMSIDAARHSAPLRKEFTKAVQFYIDQMSLLAPSMTETTRHRNASAVLAEMVGAVILSRAVEDDIFSQNILDDVVADLLES